MDELAEESMELAGETWGRGIVQQLVGDLQLEFPGVGGFSASNLRQMKGFFETCRGLEKIAPLVREIGRRSRVHPVRDGRGGR